jgi:hypothetical protein
MTAVTGDKTRVKTVSPITANDKDYIRLPRLPSLLRRFSDLILDLPVVL